MGLNETLYKLEGGHPESPKTQRNFFFIGLITLLVGAFMLIGGISTLCGREKLPAVVTNVEIIGGGRGAIAIIHFRCEYQGRQCNCELFPGPIAPYFTGQKISVYIEPGDFTTATTVFDMLGLPGIFLVIGLVSLFISQYVGWKNQRYVMEEARKQVLQYPDIE